MPREQLYKSPYHVSAHAPCGRALPPPFASVTLTRANPANTVGTPQPVFLNVAMFEVSGEVVSVKIIQVGQEFPTEKRADVELIFEPGSIGRRSREAVLEAVVQRLDLSQKQTAQACALAEQFQSNPRSVWSYVQGLTRLRQHTRWQDGRFALYRAAGRLLTSVS